MAQTRKKRQRHHEDIRYNILIFYFYTMPERVVRCVPFYSSYSAHRKIRLNEQGCFTVASLTLCLMKV